MAATDDLLTAFEYHSPEKIRAAIDAGESATEPIKGMSPLQALWEMYSRSSRFARCVEVLLEAGAKFDDPLLEAILLDDPDRLPNARDRRMDLNCTFTSLRNVTPLHVCAEYNSLKCARALLNAGAEVNARAAVDAEGLGGHTPIFHTVNSNRNFARPTMELLVEAGADLSIMLRGLLWGEGFDWETTVYNVTPISYAQCGLYRQVHRAEEDTYASIEYLCTKLYGAAPRRRNVPNRYLTKG